jgi:small subunit ribosomal protein S29
MRKKLSLTNVNAIEIKDLKDLTPDNASQDRLAPLHARMMGLQQATVDSLRALEAFRHTQAWSFFRRPATLVRKDTLLMAGKIERLDARGVIPVSKVRSIQAPANPKASGEAVSESEQGLSEEEYTEIPKAPQTARSIITGAKGTGKSVLQLQAMAMALQRGWIVVHIPDGNEITIGHTAYEPISTPDGVVYIQPQATAKLLSNVLNANRQLLMKLRVSQQHKLAVPLKENMTLAELVQLGAAQADLAWPVWKAFWTELSTPTDPKSGVERPKVLFTMDGIDHAMRESSYLDRLARPIHAHRLALIKHFTSLLSGEVKLPNGGMIIGATSGSNRPQVPTFDICLAKDEARRKLSSTGLWSPFIAHDKLVQQVMRTVDVWYLDGIDRPEARGIIDYYAQSGMLRDTVTDNLVSEKWAIAGRGIIGEIERATIRMRV